MVKAEPPSTDSDSDTPQTPLAASTQKTPPKKAKAELRQHSYDDDEDSESGIAPTQSQTSIVSNTPTTVRNTKEKYLNKFPFVQPSKPKYSVDIDLSDSGDEMWIVKCPASIDAKKVLLGAKFESFSAGMVSKIHSTHAHQQLEGVLVKNATEKPVTIMTGTDFKSFIPAGTIQIRESLEMGELPVRPVKSELSKSTIDVEEEEIPFPEEIRDRHPLLGFNYQSVQKLPKRVKKALSLAQQRSEAFYLQKEVAPLEAVYQATEPETTPSKGKRSKKRKREDTDMDFVDPTPADDAIKVMIKEEAQSPSPRKKKVKKEDAGTTPAEDDLSWLDDM